jgi:ribonuclease P protein component
VPREGGADQRLSASERIRLGHEYEHVYEEGHPHRAPLLVLFVLRDPKLARKAGFVAGKRVGGAVARNRAKRLMREAYRRSKRVLPESGVHLILVARAGCGEAAYVDVEAQLLGLFEGAGLIRGSDASHKDAQ